MEQTELKLTTEKEIVELQRQYKHALANLERVKNDTNDVLVLKDRVTREINERNDELTKVLNDISNEKLTWSLKKQEEINAIDEKNRKADEIIKKKGELDEQEFKINKIKEEAVEARNEQRRLELANKATILELESVKNEIQNSKNILEQEKVSFSNSKEELKANVAKLLHEITSL